MARPHEAVLAVLEPDDLAGDQINLGEPGHLLIRRIPDPSIPSPSSCCSSSAPRPSSSAQCARRRLGDGRWEKHGGQGAPTSGEAQSAQRRRAPGGTSVGQGERRHSSSRGSARVGKWEIHGYNGFLSMFTQPICLSNLMVWVGLRQGDWVGCSTHAQA